VGLTNIPSDVKARNKCCGGGVGQIVTKLSSNASARSAPILEQLSMRVLIAVLAGIAIGIAFPDFGTSLKPLGDAFIKLVNMAIAPVIFLTITVGLGNIRDLRQVGNVAWKAAAYFLTISTLALIWGLIAANLVQPGVGMALDISSLGANEVAALAHRAEDQSFVGVLLDVIPNTLISAFKSGEILQILLIALLCGVSIARIGPAAAPLLKMLESVNIVIFKLINIIMKLAPVGAFGALAYTVGRFGVDSLTNLVALTVTLYVTSFLFIVLILGAIAKLSGFSLLRLIYYLREEMLLVLGTSTSESALPGLIEKMQQAGCKKEVVGIVVPTAYSFNLDGINIYITLAAVFIAQAAGIDLTLGEQVLLIVVSIITSKGAGAVSGAGFIVLASTLSIMHIIPIAGMALILGIDRLMSECRSITNFIGNAVATLAIARWENAIDEEKLNEALVIKSKYIFRN
jgi:aerobic C4-dicarboxylate transport protein